MYVAERRTVAPRRSAAVRTDERRADGGYAPSRAASSDQKKP